MSARRRPTARLSDLGSTADERRLRSLRGVWRTARRCRQTRTLQRRFQARGGTTTCLKPMLHDGTGAQPSAGSDSTNACSSRCAVLLEPRLQLAPTILGIGLVVARPVIRVEPVLRLRIDDD